MYKTTVFLLIIGIMLYSDAGFGQETKVDSLKIELRKAGTLDDSLSLSSKVGGEYLYSNLDSSLKYYILFRELATRSGDSSILGKACVNTGVAFAEKNMKEESLAHYKRALQIYKNIKADSSRIVNLYYNILINMIEDNQFVESKLVYDTAISYLPHGDINKEFSLNSILSMMFNRQQDYISAIKYEKRNLAIANQTGDLAQKAYTYAGLGDDYNNIEMLDSSIHYYRLAVDLFENSPDQVGYARQLTNLGGNLMIQEEYDSALETLLKSEKLMDEMGMEDYCSNYSALAWTYYHLGDEERAKAYSEKIFDLVDNPRDVGCLLKALDAGAKVLYKVGEYKKGYDMLVISQDFQDSLTTLENRNMILDLEKRLDLKEKEGEIASQKLQIEKQEAQSRNLLWTILGIIGLVCVIIYTLISRQKRKKAIADMALSAEKREKQSLLELDRMKSQFFTNISHELKTPLTLITGPLEELSKDESIKGKSKEVLLLAKRNSQKLLDLVNEILQLSRLETGELPVREQPLNVDAFLKRLFYSFQSFAESQDIQLNYLSNAKENHVMLDPDHIERIISNLISNAIKYTHGEGEVRMNVMVEDIGEKVRLAIEVADNGPGIADDQLPHVFDRFYQTPTSSGKEMGGVGIGLSLASQLARLIDGKLEVQSQVGKGSVFIFKMECEKAEIIQVAESETVDYQPNLEKHKEKSILVVEDNKDMQEYLAQILSPHFHLIQAYDGAEALQIIQTQNKIDLITSDIMMPKMDGYRLRELVLQLPGARRIPFLFLSARSLEDDIMKGFALGVDDYITKPFHADALLARIENLLNNSAERQAHAAREGYEEARDLTVIEKFEAIVRREIADSDIKMAQIADELNIGERQLRRLTKAETGMSPVELILEMRLLKARKLLESGRFSTVAEVMYQVGIESSSYFSKKITQRFGQSPSQMMG